jgi:hypothetical protein
MLISFHISTRSSLISRTICTWGIARTIVLSKGKLLTPIFEEEQHYHKLHEINAVSSNAMSVINHQQPILSDPPVIQPDWNNSAKTFEDVISAVVLQCLDKGWEVISLEPSHFVACVLWVYSVRPDVRTNETQDARHTTSWNIEIWIFFFFFGFRIWCYWR